MFWKRKPKFSADDLASFLYEICNDDAEIKIPRPDLSRQQIELYLKKSKLYKVAGVISALMLNGNNDRYFLEVKTHFEKLIFPDTPTEEGIRLLAELREAMNSLHELIFQKSERIEFSWALKWFEDIGIKETNPAILAEQALSNIDFYSMIKSFIQASTSKS